MTIEKLIHQPGAGQLILCLAGWSASPQLFGSLQARSGQDVWVCYDYRQLSFTEPLTPYHKVYLVAWSLGVWVAQQLFAPIIRQTAPTIQWTTVAVNGTGTPVSDRCGIPTAIFQGTLQQLNEATRQRFNRRMCGSGSHFDAYRQLPQRPLDEIKEELQLLHDRICSAREPEPMHWDKVWLSRHDRIFPIGNLRNYWKGHPAVSETDTPHQPFYQWNRWEELWN